MTIDEWQNELVDKVGSALDDMAEIEDEKVEAETAVFSAKLFSEVTDNDLKQAQAIGEVVASYMNETDQILYRG